MFATGDARDAEILALRHQILVPQRQIGRPHFPDTDRTILSLLVSAMERARRHTAFLIVRPETVLRWHRRPVARHWTQRPTATPGRPPIQPELRRLVIRVAQESSTWRYRRIHGELLRLGHSVAASTVWKILRAAGIHPTRDRTRPSWAGIIATDFACVDTALLRRFHVLFVIEIASRRVDLAGISTNPTGHWATQAARNLLMALPDAHGLRFLIRDGAGQFTASFHTVFAGAGITATRTPPRAPQANAYAERWIRTLRHELLDRTVIGNERQLRTLLTECVAHYNQHRPHRGLGQRAPDDHADIAPIGPGQPIDTPPAADSSTSTAPPPEFLRRRTQYSEVTASTRPHLRIEPADSATTASAPLRTSSRRTQGRGLRIPDECAALG